MAAPCLYLPFIQIMVKGCSGFISIGDWQQKHSPSQQARYYRSMPPLSQPRDYSKRTSALVLASGTGEEDEEDDDEEDEIRVEDLVPLTLPKFKNIEVREIQSMEEAGRLVLSPFFQRGFKWKQPQSSLYIESILRGYPCIPEVTLLETEDEDGETQYATFDGQQRLTSIVSYIRDDRADFWKPTKLQRSNNVHTSFALEKLPLLKHLEGKTFKDLEKRDQNKIKNFDVRCAILPSSWDMADYIGFFARIQGGGTPMSDHELRRAITRGPFTDLLDELAHKPEVVEALDSTTMKADEIQELLLRYYAAETYTMKEFGKPSHQQQGLKTMKAKNVEMLKWSAGDSPTKRDALARPLLDALKLLVVVFDKDELFRRPQPLIKKKKLQSPNQVWVGKGTTVNKHIWDCLVVSFADLERKYHSDIRTNSDEIRDALMTIFQTHPDFTDSLQKTGTPARIAVVTNQLREILLLSDNNTKISTSSHRNDVERASIPVQIRTDLISEALKSKAACPLCHRQLSPYEAHLHIDHIHPRSKGGSNDLSNLQVVHKTCNLRKSNNVSL